MPRNQVDMRNAIKTGSGREGRQGGLERGGGGGAEANGKTHWN